MNRHRQTQLKLNHTRRRLNGPASPPPSPLDCTSTTTTGSDARTENILSQLQFSNTQMEEFMNLRPFVTVDKSGTETRIPASYVREKGTSRFLRTWMSRDEATHYLVFTTPRPVTWPPTPPQSRHDHDHDDEREGGGLLYPVHEWVMASQSIAWSRRTQQDNDEEEEEEEEEGKGIDGVPVVELSVPHQESIHALLLFLHNHDEEDLYRVLTKQWQSGSVEGETWVRGFIANVVQLGILDARIRGVVWAVIEPEP